MWLVENPFPWPWFDQLTMSGDGKSLRLSAHPELVEGRASTTPLRESGPGQIRKFVVGRTLDPVVLDEHGGVLRNLLAV